MTSFVDDNVFPKLLINDAGVPSTPAAGVIALYVDPADDHFKYKDDAAVVTDITGGLGGAGTSLYKAYVRIQQQLATGTDNGGTTAGSFQDCPLNTLVDDPGGNVVSLAGNAFQLAAGTYRIEASQPLAVSNRAQLRLRNSTAGTTLLAGQPLYLDQTNLNIVSFSLRGRFTIASGQSLKLQYYVQNAHATNGLGANSGSGESEIYGIVELFKE